MAITGTHATSYLIAGFHDAGVSLVTNHPGFRSNELMEGFHGSNAITSVNERTAFAVAWGHALGGRRAAVAMKNVGLNDASDAFLNSLALDLNAGFVVVVFDDTDVEHSQMRMDSRHYQSFAGGAWLEPGSMAEARRFARDAFELSERLSMPVVLRITNALLGRGSTVVPKATTTKEVPLRPFLRQPANHVIHPANHPRHHENLLRKHGLIGEWASNICRTMNPSSSARPGEVHLVVGAARQPREVPAEWIFRLPCLPIPESMIQELARTGVGIHVHEHGDPIVAKEVRSVLCHHKVTERPSGSIHPNRSYHCRSDLAPVFSLLRSFPSPVVIGDLGGYTMDPDQSIDACLCYGASVAVALGFSLASPDSSVACVCGDGAFLHSAKSAVAEAVARDCRLLIIVLENGGCRGTGGQALPGITFYDHSGVQEEESSFVPSDPADCLSAIRRLAGLPGVKILHLHTPF